MRKLVRVLIYTFSIFGSMLDHVTTCIGLQHSLIYETNPLTQALMSTGLWGILSIVSCILPVLIVELLIRWKPKLSLLLAFPATGGVLRLIAGIHNILLLLAVM